MPDLDEALLRFQLTELEYAGGLANHGPIAPAALAVPGADALGPQPCALERLRGLYRYDVLLRARRSEAMQQVLDHLRGAGLLRPRVKSFIVDVDPLSLS